MSRLRNESAETECASGASRVAEKGSFLSASNVSRLHAKPPQVHSAGAPCEQAASDAETGRNLLAHIARQPRVRGAHGTLYLRRLVAPYDARPLLKPVPVGLEPRLGWEGGTTSARIIPLGTAEAGESVGPLFEGILRDARLHSRYFYMFDFCAVRVGCATNVHPNRRNLLWLGAEELLRHLESGPCVILCVSRNCMEWILARCPRPGTLQWVEWRGRDLGGDLGRSLSTARHDGLREYPFTFSGFRHVILLLPNPSDVSTQAIRQRCEMQATKRLAELCWGS